MTAIDKNSILEGYLKLLESLPNSSKQLIIKRLQAPEKSAVENNIYNAAFGAWVGNESAEEIIETIKMGRSIKSIREIL